MLLKNGHSNKLLFFLFIVLLVNIKVIFSDPALYGVTNTGCLIIIDTNLGQTTELHCFGNSFQQHPPTSSAIDRVNRIIYLTTGVGTIYGFALNNTLTLSKSFLHQNLQGIKWDDRGRKLIFKQLYSNATSATNPTLLYQYDITTYNQSTSTSKNILMNQLTGIRPCSTSVTLTNSSCNLKADMDEINRIYYLPDLNDTNSPNSTFINQIAAINLQSKQKTILQITDPTQQYLVDVRNVRYYNNQLVTVASFYPAQSDGTVDLSLLGVRDVASIDVTSGQITRQNVFDSNQGSQYVVCCTIYQTVFYVLMGQIDRSSVTIYTIDLSSSPFVILTQQTLNSDAVIYTCHAMDSTNPETAPDYVDDDMLSPSPMYSYSSGTTSSSGGSKTTSYVLLGLLLALAVVAGAAAAVWLYLKWKARQPSYLN